MSPASPIYLSGPMSHYPGHNITAFKEAAGWLRDQGYEVLSPHEIDLPENERTWKNYMVEDIKLVLRAQTVVVLEGWECSRGAKLEVTLAHALEIPVLPLDMVLE